MSDKANNSSSKTTKASTIKPTKKNNSPHISVKIL